MMDDHDRANLEFLLTATPEALKEWSEEVTQDDLDYAQELLDAYQLELDQRVQMIGITETHSKEFEQAIVDAQARGSVYWEFEEYSVH
jgi:hypothetical protein